MRPHHHGVFDEAPLFCAEGTELPVHGGLPAQNQSQHFFDRTSTCPCEQQFKLRHVVTMSCCQMHGHHIGALACIFKPLVDDWLTQFRGTKVTQ